MKRSIFSEIFGGYFLIILLLSSLVFFFSSKTIRSYYIETLTSNLKNLGIAIENDVKPFINKGEFDRMDTFIKRLGKKIHTRITIIRPDGLVLADSEKDPKTMENHKGRPEVKMALKGEMGHSLRFSVTVKQEMLYVALPIEQNGQIIAIVRTSLFLKDINNLLATLEAKILQIVLLVVIFSVLIAFVFSRGFSRPIRNLASAAREVASENFDVRVSLRTNNELQELANSFNYMIEKIKALFADISLKKEELNNIISSLQEGLLVLDEKGKIILCNDSFKKIAENKAPEGKFWWEIVRSAPLDELIEKGSQEKKNLIKEIALGDKIFLTSITFIPSMNEISLIFHNITEVTRLEKIKKDFVLNVSHELRTPLTAIKGFIETLDEEIDAKHKHYLHIIKRNTDRLINIVQDLLILSNLEEKNIQLNIEQVDLKHLIDEVLVLFGPKIKEKGLLLELDLDDVPQIPVDPFRLEQALINLIDNAIKYTDKGGIKITLKRDSNYIMIGIRDTGIGIPHNDIDRIFERFYVVDKSRSRKLGGTGLGLSIVKHIVLLHNGKIDIESVPGKGTKFTIRFPFERQDVVTST